MPAPPSKRHPGPSLPRARAWIVAVAALALLAIPGYCGTLWLKAGAVNTSASGLSVLSSGYSGRHWIVQMRGTPHDADRAALERAGARVVGYVPDNAYLVEASGAPLAAVRGISSVAACIPYFPHYRIDPAAASASVPVEAYVLGFDEPAFANTLEQIRRTKGASVLAAQASAAVVRASGRTLRLISRLPDVRWIELAPRPKLHNIVARQLTGVTEAWESVGLFGAGQTLAIADTGLDVGAANPNLSLDFRGRVSASFGLGRPGITDDPDGHGTHVAGIAAGSGVLSGASPAGHSYSDSLAGAAPEASLIIQSLLDNSGGLGGIPSNLGTLFDQAYSAGARVHSDSWGSEVSGAYAFWSQQLDQYVWDHPDMVVLFSAGNEGADLNSDGVIDPDSINAPATAKNCIAVGASESNRATGGRQYPWATGSSAPLYPAEPIGSDLMSDDPQGLAAFSSRGPCDDGRIKPDIVAPGTNIVSARSHMPTATSGWGVYNSDYIYLDGSSAATPLVAGAAAIVRQHYVTVQGHDPSASLVKATLLASASDLTPGQYGSGPYLEIPPRPNPAEGWGRLNLKTAVAVPPPAALHYVDNKTGLSTGQVFSQTFQVIDSSVPLRVMLVWSDYPAEPSAGKALVNDLDLTVTPPSGGILNGNGSLDRTNNVEGIDIAYPQDGAYTVQVSAYNIPQGPQSFSLVVIGGLPRTFISGVVRTAYAAPIPGVLVTATSGSKHYSAISIADGTYAINVPEGNYEVVPARNGWSFSPASRQIPVASTGVGEVDFEGSAAKASISGTVRDGQTQPVQGFIWESAHPYENSTDSQMEIAGPPNAVRIRLHFAKIDTEPWQDIVYLKSAAGTVVSTYSGLLEDHWTRWMDGSKAFVQLVTGGSGTGWGWRVNAAEVTVAGPAHPGASLREATGNTTASAGPTGAYSFPSLDPTPNSISLETPGWMAKPVSRPVWPEPGAAVPGVDFVLVPEPPIAHIRINHGRVNDLIVTVGVGDPDSPLYSKVIAQHAGMNNTSLIIDAQLDDAAAYFPPSQEHSWFVKACDYKLYNAGQITSFGITRDGWDWQSIDTPLIISDLGCAVSRIPSQDSSTIGQVKHSFDSTQVNMWGAVVSAVFPDRIYVQDPDGTAGIGVNGFFDVNVGDVVTVTGVALTFGCEKLIENAQVFVNRIEGSEARALAMTNAHLGGKPDEFGNPGFVDSPHMNNMGLLVRIAGRVTAAGPDWFYLNDGSAPEDGSGYSGIRVSTEGFAAPQPGRYVIATGISSCHEEGFTPGRLVRTRSASDVVVADSPAPLLQEGFESGAPGWQPLPGHAAMQVTTERAHGGSRSFGSSGGAASFRSFEPGFGPYVGLVGWFYDDASAQAGRQALESRWLGEPGYIRQAMAVGVDPNVSISNYCVFTTGGGWVETTALRSAGWHKFGMRLTGLLPPSNNVVFYVDDAEVASGLVEPGTQVSQVVVGDTNGGGTWNGWFDDITLGYGL